MGAKWHLFEILHPTPHSHGDISVPHTQRYHKAYK